jgi:hypothetical protein
LQQIDYRDFAAEQLAARRTLPIDRQHRYHTRPGHIGRLLIQARFEKSI